MVNGIELAVYCCFSFGHERTSPVLRGPLRKQRVTKSGRSLKKRTDDQILHEQRVLFEKGSEKHSRFELLMKRGQHRRDTFGSSVLSRLDKRQEG